jgi:hypothetical protein
VEIRMSSQDHGADTWPWPLHVCAALLLAGPVVTLTHYGPPGALEPVLGLAFLSAFLHARGIVVVPPEPRVECCVALAALLVWEPRAPNAIALPQLTAAVLFLAVLHRPTLEVLDRALAPFAWIGSRRRD